jgi:O-antigen/teichoic acid export membrane protein
MSMIRRQAIISSLLIYIGFAFGALNTYLFTKAGGFTPEQYGLTRAFITLGQFFYGFAGFGLASVAYKFYPYYKDHVPKDKNDLLTLILAGSLVGFVITCAGGLIFESVVVRKFVENSPLVLRYYYWIFPFTFFLLFFSMLEAYAWSSGRTVLPNFLRETGFRVSTTVLIVVFFLTGKNFDLFIRLFSLLYAISFITLFIYLIRQDEVRIVTRISIVTRKFRKKMFTLMAFIYGGSLIQVTAQSIDFLAIASMRGLRYGAVFDFSSYLANVIQVPQRSLISVTIPVLSRAWKDKDYATIDRVYRRSSLNLLLASLFIFSFIWLNYDNAVEAFNLDPVYREGKWAVFLLGMKNVVDMGTGVNGQIIATSTYWRFDFLSGIFLLILIVPLNIVMVKLYGIEGAAMSNLLSYIVYNTIRVIFLKRKFNLMPFSMQTLYVIIHAAACFGVVYLLFGGVGGWMGLILRSIAYGAVFIITAVWLRLSPDIAPVMATLKKKFRGG